MRCHHSICTFSLLKNSPERMSEDHSRSECSSYIGLNARTMSRRYHRHSSDMRDHRQYKETVALSATSATESKIECAHFSESTWIGGFNKHPDENFCVIIISVIDSNATQNSALSQTFVSTT